jgi:hypothetical protein
VPSQAGFRPESIFQFSNSGVLPGAGHRVFKKWLRTENRSVVFRLSRYGAEKWQGFLAGQKHARIPRQIRQTQ